MSLVKKTLVSSILAFYDSGVKKYQEALTPLNIFPSDHGFPYQQNMF